MAWDRSSRVLMYVIKLRQLLTGEGYVLLKTFGDSLRSTSWFTVPDGVRITDKPAASLIRETENDEKILDLTRKIIELLTGEVPIRYEDTTVFFTKEEWRYVEEHKNLYKDVLMENIILPKSIGDNNYKILHSTSLEKVSDSKTTEHDKNIVAEKILHLIKELKDLLTKEIEKYPEIWDRASDLYKDKQRKKDAWASVLREIYTQWVNEDRDAQEEIMCDVKSRWRSVTDRLVKYHQSVKSGASPRKRKVPYADELAFMLTSRSLRRTEGNISAPSTQTDTRTDEVEEEFHPIVHLSSPETSASATDGCPASSSVTQADVDTGLGTAAPGPSAAGSSTGDVSRPTWRGSASARPVASRRATKKKAKRHEGATCLFEALTKRTLSLVERTYQEDPLDLVGLSIAGRLRSMPREKQNIYITPANALLTAIDGAYVMPSTPAIVNVMHNLFNPSVPPPPPAAATQRFGQVEAYRPEEYEGTYGHQMAPGGSSFLRGPSPNASFTQEMFSGYGFEQQFHNL
ncbi:uncharacterized protein [Phyllobates terribilis]|uniref:uncharacterized protein isoform X3 n=1 Tax=Phyllobates terribilis TaxID=111132 RepID=UPI003CCB506E